MYLEFRLFNVAYGFAFGRKSSSHWQLARFSIDKIWYEHGEVVMAKKLYRKL
jgi:hypothetical protein